MDDILKTLKTIETEMQEKIIGIDGNNKTTFLDINYKTFAIRIYKNKEMNYWFKYAPTIPKQDKPINIIQKYYEDMKVRMFLDRVWRY